MIDTVIDGLIRIYLTLGAIAMLGVGVLVVVRIHDTWTAHHRRRRVRRAMRGGGW